MRVKRYLRYRSKVRGPRRVVNAKLGHRLTGISVNSLWPKTVIATDATEFEAGGPSVMKAARLLAIMPAACAILSSRERRIRVLVSLRTAPFCDNPLRAWNLPYLLVRYAAKRLTHKNKLRSAELG
jgi:hypothetical protein